MQVYDIMYYFRLEPENCYIAMKLGCRHPSDEDTKAKFVPKAQAMVAETLQHSIEGIIPITDEEYLANTDPEDRADDEGGEEEDEE